MSEEFELRPDQWDALKALRAPAANPSRLNRFAVESLIALGYVAVRGDAFALTPAGRKVLVRGSSQLLLDIAA
ncbi:MULTISPECIES: hypothetical protein [unclassified Bradyrhizobium]|uniref:hypothetical protein n=1 Tax=unclassified Bradyrhizobium TaxID=2631580 RepID=UPI000406CA67|nr:MULTISPECIES: hypothetical protein [unclassified Bradyrhizobium]QIG98037.1 hypothetical protein G6P99_41375 [Bradyrhizobium sp. 6(2017)]